MSRSVEVTLSGPIYDGQADNVIADFLDDAETEFGRDAVNRIHARLRTVLKNPTGRYERNIVTDRRQGNLVVTDNKIVYGPWLEGVSSRNTRTRFKGYSTFRRTFQQIDADTQGKANDMFKTKYLGRLS